MPSLGADMEHGRVIEWMVKPGDHVKRGDIVATVDTDKALMDVESFDDGVIAELLVEPGTDVPVGAVLARITGTPAAEAPPPVPEPVPMPPPEPMPRPEPMPPPEPITPPIPAPAPEPVPPPAPVPRPEPSAPPLTHVHGVTPPVRHLAHRLGVDLAAVHGSGKSGAITRGDVQRAAGTSPAAAPARVRSSAYARKLATDLHIDLSTVPGTGPQGAVVEADVRRAAAAPPAPETAPAPVAVGQATGERAASAGPTAEERSASMRRAVGALMARSKREIPHYYLHTTIDLRAATDWMQATNAGRPVMQRLVPAALLLKATALAAREIPEMNGFWVDDGFRPSTSVHLGVAVALRKGGLVAPAIHDADTLPLDALMDQLRDLVARARGGRLQRAEMSDPTITVTNLGDLGVEAVYGVIYPPQVALVGFGKVVEQPFAQDGLLGVRTAVTATLSADHRVSDGLRGGRFLDRIHELLQKPEEL